ncbi:MAG TPA: aldehyde dehydrogenase family protein, partial [Oceanospirillaceae bacterium]|nr:aldehyde dehydrogenase family protein [Oceanospirillaceae bacterium]
MVMVPLLPTHARKVRPLCNPICSSTTVSHDCACLLASDDDNYDEHDHDYDRDDDDDHCHRAPRPALWCGTPVCPSSASEPWFSYAFLDFWGPRVALHKFAAKVAELQVGNGMDEGVTQGPMINHGAIDKVKEHIEDALSKGGNLVCGGESHALGGSFFTPTIIGNATTDMKVAT